MYAPSVVSCSCPFGSPGLHGCGPPSLDPSVQRHSPSLCRSVKPIQHSSAQSESATSFSAAEWTEARCIPRERQAA